MNSTKIRITAPKEDLIVGKVTPDEQHLKILFGKCFLMLYIVFKINY